MMTVNRNKFDFEIGYFVESPCRNCDKWRTFPLCEEECRILDKLRGILAEGISCCYSSAEA